ncbi:MAG: class I SAM-dependent methyltransferase [Candidatus Omnitrophica bacterium]|nr:class I SAM-dependent methyltransferase [Candidatus Omnitrophota bacterium]
MNIQIFIKKVKNKLKTFWLQIATLRSANLRWLFRNRYLRMDANVTTNPVERRIFHIDRYKFAVNKLRKVYSDTRNLLIVDVACGTGYGSDILKKVNPKKIIGIDICPETVKYAQKKYGTHHCIFNTSDAVEMNIIKSGTVDVVVSFETIEHLEQPIIFLKNVKRVLKNKGCLIISTPNSWGETRDHRFDYDYQLLKTHLEQFFTIDSMYVQNSGSMNLWMNRGFQRRLIPVSPDNVNEAECFIAIARNYF